jgi:hypothetical protein
MAFLEIVRFVISHNHKPEFAKLREYLSFHGGIKNQYHGDMIAPSSAALPIRPNEMCWAIRIASTLNHIYILQLTLRCRVAARL